jgi:hypothetical protein
MPENPFAEMIPADGVLASSGHWKGQYGTLLLRARKRYFREAWGWGPEQISAELKKKNGDTV